MTTLSLHAKLLLDIATQEAKRRGHNPVVPVRDIAPHPSEGPPADIGPVGYL